MFEFLPETEGNVIGVQPHGKLTDRDYTEGFFPKVDEVLAEHDKVRFLFYPGQDFHGWELSALWDDVKFGAKHRHDVDKIAVVGAPKMLQWASRLAQHFIDCEFRTFEKDQYSTAWEWIKA